MFDLLANLSKLLRLLDIHHKIKLDRDAFHDDKRTNAEARILSEVKTATARGNVLLKKMLKVERRVSNIEKLIEALYKTVGFEGLMKNIAENAPEPIPEDGEIEEEADVEITQELVRLQTLDGNDDKVIENEDELMDELYGNVTVSDPDELTIVTTKELTHAQILYRKRYESVAAAKEIHGFHVTVGEGPYSHKRYSDLMSDIERYNFTGLTEVGPPISQDKFKDRYKKYWEPHMTLVSDFDSRPGRISQPRDLKLKIKQEQDEEVASTSRGPPKKKGKGKKSLLKPVKEVPEPESESDFEAPDLGSPSRKRSHGPPTKDEPKEKKPRMGINAKKSWYK